MSRHFGAGMQNKQAEKPKVLLILAMFFGVLFAALAFVFLSSGSPQAATTSVVIEDKPPEMRLVDVLVPLRQIEAGQELQPSLFRVERRPQIGLDSRMIRDIEQIKGYFARTLIVPGQPLHLDYVTNVRPNSAISSSIPTGFRAVSIRVNATSSVEGWARPGSKVDVVWASKIRGQAGITTIVQNAKVLSSDRQVQQNAAPGMPVPTTVTLLVSAKDAQKIQLAQTTGSLTLSLRGDQDAGKAETAGSITVDDLLGGSKSRRISIPNNKGTVTIDGKKWIVDQNGQLEAVGSR